MAASKTTIFIVFLLYLSCALLVSPSGIQAHRSCRNGHCICERLKAEIEPTKTIRCKTDRDCPDSRKCPIKDYYYSCLHGECTCRTV
ncbi:defensin-like protein 291 [Eutrema salsugineum]|uniref:defensin-like protein 291 n=1 Tax=Eutrema salsugineum TaxID=72664 RepID=UPI000CED6D65|nr:defensin-like protein 291 [Eutrema salsugineum]